MIIRVIQPGGRFARQCRAGPAVQRGAVPHGDGDHGLDRGVALPWPVAGPARPACPWRSIFVT